MANNTNNNKDPKNKIIRINIGLSWLYIPLLVGLLYLAFFSGGSNPQKAEWSDVKEMVASGDVKDILFIRNDFKGEVTIKPDKLAKYSERFGGKVPSASPHFWFYVSNKFDPEAEFDRLNSELPADSQVKIIMENDDNVWGHIMDWFLFPILLIASGYSCSVDSTGIWGLAEPVGRAVFSVSENLQAGLLTRIP